MTLLDRLMPDFLGIGAQRAGTTWLWVQLRGHPQIWTPRRKELHFFDRAIGEEDPGWPARPAYGVHFVPGRLRGRVVGEVTPAYATLPDHRVALIAEWMPRVRIFYVLRDPVARAWSQAAKSFPRWAGRTIEQAKEEELLDFLQLPEVRSRGDYVHAVRTWRRHFPADQILVCVSELLFADPEGQLRDVLRFLRVDPAVPLDPAVLRARVHAGTLPPMPAGVREWLTAFMHAQRAELESMLNTTLPWGR